MKCTAAFLLLALVALVAPLLADEPHLQVVQGLRDKQLPDYALQYLEALKLKKLPPELAALLPLEAAKTRLSMAVLEADPGKRTALQNQARAEFESFLKNNPKHP